MTKVGEQQTVTGWERIACRTLCMWREEGWRKDESRKMGVAFGLGRFRQDLSAHWRHKWRLQCNNNTYLDNC